jgi:hypothetical protein
MKMNKASLMLGLVAVFVFVTASVVQSQGQKSYTGVVTASQIASSGGSSGMGIWMKKLNCHSEADCAQRLVGAGGKYVLVTSKGVYQLNDQTKAAQFVAQRVTVTGSFDSVKKTIEVADVQVYSGSSTTSAGVQ